MVLHYVNFAQIFQIEIELDLNTQGSLAAKYIFLHVMDKTGKLAVYQLSEMDHKMKVQMLVQKKMFNEALSIAKTESFPADIQAEISKEHADLLYTKKKDYDSAIELYIKTIGYLNPSYVIQRYIEVQQLSNLIKYLERLILSPAGSLSESAFNQKDYHKDYTTLLLNCYVKMDETHKIKELIERLDEEQPQMFDIDTAIEVCRQQSKTLHLAELLASKIKDKNELLVQIKIYNRGDYESALQTIVSRISNLKDRVLCLQRYAPKFLKTKQESAGKDSGYQDQILALVREIADALVDFVKNNGEFDVYKDKFTLKPAQKIRIEDLLQIFVDDPGVQESLLEYLVDKIGKKDHKCLEQLSSINLYHRKLEYNLYMRQMRHLRGEIEDAEKEKTDFQKKVAAFIGDHDTKIDKNYILFLFQIYEYPDGVRICCEKLGLKQELLSFYIQRGDIENVMAVCNEVTKNDPKLAGTLWVQALTFFC